MTIILIAFFHTPVEVLAQKPWITEADYARAYRLMSYNLNSLVQDRVNGSGWLPDDRLWYNKNTPGGHKFFLLDIRKKSTKELFDHVALAKILSEENTKVAEYLKKNKDKNFIDAYKELGIVICDKNGNEMNETNLLKELIVL